MRSHRDTRMKMATGLNRCLNHKPFNRMRMEAMATPGNIKQPHPGGENTCTAGAIPARSPRQEVLPFPIRPDQTMLHKRLQPFGRRDGFGSPWRGDKRVRSGGRRALQPPGVTVHLCLTLWGERAAAGGCDRRVAGAGSLHRVPPHTDVLPSSLRERRDGKVALARQRKILRF